MPPINVVAISSNSLIKKGLKKIAKNQFSKQRVIGPKNHYITDTRTKTNILANGSFPETDHLCQYIAASTFTHCFDGWNYLSQGINSFINGDIPTCIHLVYYSELRAVMGILACEGVGIFDRKHAYFDTANNKKVHTNGTHPAANELIKEWAGLASKKENIFNSIKVNNRTLNKWIDASGHSSNSGYVSSIVKDWFDSWSIDLRLAEDKDLRNQMSYRPHFSHNPVDINDTLKKIVSIWEGLEPAASSRFVELDKHLLRLAIEFLFTRVTGKSKTDPSFRTFIDHIFNSLGESTSQYLYDFILRINNPEDHILIEEARKDILDNDFNKKNPFPMICRSILLLRFSTGCANHFFTSSTISISDLSFWWEELAVKFGIVDNITPGLNPSDLYSDITDSISDLSSIMPGITDIYKLNNSASTEICSLKQFQRVCFWGLGI